MKEKLEKIMKEDKETKKRLGVIVISLVLMIGLVIGLTYAAFNYSRSGSNENTITTAIVSMRYDTEEKNGISLTDAMPVSDSVGRIASKDEEVFDFTIDIKTNNHNINYEVTAEKTAGDMENNDVRLYLEKSNDKTNYSATIEPSYYTPLGVVDDFGASATEMKLDSGSETNKKTYYYKFRMWVAERYEMDEVSRSFTVKINVYGTDSSVTTKSVTATEYIRTLANINTETMMADDGTDDHNTRYYGAKPNNYVTFNGETAGWRIIGVFGDNIKLIRATSIGTEAWNTNTSNNWNTASLNTLLNSGDYYTRSGDYESIGLTSIAKSMVSTRTWNLGAAAWGDDTNPNASSGRNKSAYEWYNLERGELVAGATGSTTLSTSKLKVGLMYPSDYGFASRSCYKSTYLRNIDNTNDYRLDTCISTNWLYSGTDNWTLSSISENSSRIWNVDGYGSLTNQLVYNTWLSIYPVVYLEDNVKITSGTGTSTDPYQLSIN